MFTVDEFVMMIVMCAASNVMSAVVIFRAMIINQSLFEFLDPHACSDIVTFFHPPPTSHQYPFMPHPPHIPTTITTLTIILVLLI